MMIIKEYRAERNGSDEKGICINEQRGTVDFEG